MKYLVSIFYLIVFSGVTQANVIFVNSTADVVADDSDCTLREALVAANQDIVFNGCAKGLGDDYIVLFIANDEILIESTLSITSDVHIEGPDTLAIKPAPSFNGVLIEINTLDNVMLEGFRIVGGRSAGLKVSLVDALILESMQFVGNSGFGAVYFPGPQNNSEALVVNGSTFTNNVSSSDGGAISIRGVLDVIITDSTFSQNTTSSGNSNGGAVYILSAFNSALYSGQEVHIINTDFIDNQTSQKGSAMSVIGDIPVLIENSRFSGNQSLSHRTVLELRTPYSTDTNTYYPASITASSFTANTGNAISIITKPATISRNLFLNNKTFNLDGLIDINESNTLFENNIFANNVPTNNNAETPTMVVLNTNETIQVPIFEINLKQNTFTDNEGFLLGGSSFTDSTTQISMANNLFNQAALTDDCFKSDTSSTIVSLGGNVHHGSGDCAPDVNDFSGASIGLLPLADYGGVVHSMPLKPDSPWLDQFSCTGDDFSGEGRPHDGDGDGVALCDLGAVESPDAHKLTLNFAGDGEGAIDLFALDVDCGSSETACEWGITQNQTHTLTATPNADSTFIQWAGACSGDTTCEVTMNTAKTVTAEFATVVKPIRLTTRKFANEPGLSATIVSAPAGIHCGRNCFADFVENDVVNLTAELGEDTVIDTWLGCDAISTNGVCKVVMGSSDRTVDLFLMQDPDIIFKDDFE
ncbi:choice-of-anchor Q domain-containing protein [Marinicella gelatinilytica]|uniref:choice-of-anchor Q domain-containing protein n=1 Tax=Marinicella gelatinilytica TaxID=2996017 RepID=UPI002260F742|nr:choice-of-anchor Q domain-containing protein [Marinicella gelatinilytica]MCX7543843.1 CSLREA domain-containing protein [Marinicella gelatinilytica]